MPEKDRLDQLTEVVAGLVEATKAQQENLDRRIDALERGLRGLSDLGGKVGALASAMDRNIAAGEKHREAFLEHQRLMREAIQAEASALRPSTPPGIDAEGRPTGGVGTLR